MRLRSKTQMREINEIRNTVQGGNNKLMSSYFWMISRAQMIVDYPTWLGAYEKAMDQDYSDKEAIALADQAVIDSQGGGQIKDLAAVQRGSPVLKLWTAFYHFFNTTYNLTAESVGRTNFRNIKDVGVLAVDMLMLYTVPAILGVIVKGGHTR